MFAGSSFVHQSLNPGSPSLVTILCRAEEWVETYRRETLGSLNDIRVKREGQYTHACSLSG